MCRSTRCGSTAGLISVLLDKALLVSDFSDAPFEESREREEALNHRHFDMPVHGALPLRDAIGAASSIGAAGTMAMASTQHIQQRRYASIDTEHGAPPNELAHVPVSAHVVQLPARERRQPILSAR